MSDGPQIPSEGAPLPSTPETPLPAAPAAPPPQRDPFWGYSDLALFIGLSLPCILLSFGLVRGVVTLFAIPNPGGATESVGALLIFYSLIFLALRIIFAVQYGRPFWSSMGWKKMRVPALTVGSSGVATAVGVAISATLLHVPETPNQMTEMMREPAALILLAIFGVTVAPVCEELAFRGFLQPLLVRTLGAVPGIVIAAAAFGLLHYSEYGNSWRHVAVLTLSGASFGAMRHFTGSTKAAALMHASYNAFLFVALFTQRKDLPHLW